MASRDRLPALGCHVVKDERTSIDRPDTSPFVFCVKFPGFHSGFFREILKPVFTIFPLSEQKSQGCHSFFDDEYMTPLVGDFVKDLSFSFVFLRNSKLLHLNTFGLINCFSPGIRRLENPLRSEGTHTLLALVATTFLYGRCIQEDANKGTSYICHAFCQYSQFQQLTECTFCRH